MKNEAYNGFLGNVSIRDIDKTDDKDPERRKEYWIRKLIK